tara:strand:- start:1069 stop:1176 length:108 start_codon:yes stop_codon:yes gene_type:complete
MTTQLRREVLNEMTPDLRRAVEDAMTQKQNAAIKQ